MNTREKLLFLAKPKHVMLYLVRHKPFCLFLTDKCALKIMYRLRMERKLHLEEPRTFNEKIQWLKVYGFRDSYKSLADKVSVRDYVKMKIGEEYLIPLLGVWDDFSEINFDFLPESFVLKGAQNGVYICRDKNKLNKQYVSSLFRKYSEYNYFYFGREPVYKNIKNRILCEKYMADGYNSELNDYKLMCFNGKVKCCFTCTDRWATDGLKVTFFNNSWERMPFERHYPTDSAYIEQPKSYKKMCELAETLSEDMPFTRIDFYEIKGRPYFGEITFYPGDGMEEFTPEEWDYTIGSWLTLPPKCDNCR